MTSISSALYSTLNPYSGLSGYTTSAAASETEEETAASATGQDTVTLSSQVSTAQAREYFGLAPTGKLTLSDFQTAADGQQETVARMLTEAMADIGIPGDQEISLSLDNDGNIAITEDFSGKEVLEEALNQDEDFLQAFSGLTTNNQVMDYAKSLTMASPSLVDFMGESTTETDLLALAKRYSAIKSANSIEDLWQVSRSETPYTYVFTAEE